MKGDLTAQPNRRRKTGTARADSPEGAWRFSRLAAARLLGGALLAAALGALLVALCAQVPARHAVDVGGYDAAYVQGFFDPERAEQPGERPYLAGSDGSSRWTRPVSYLLFPQAGLPGAVTLRLRGPDAGAEVQVLLNGEQELGRFTAGPSWQERRFAIAGGLRKLTDVVIELRSTGGRASPADARVVGVLLDRAMYTSAPPLAAPYPAQLAYGAAAGALLFLLTIGGGSAGAPRRISRPAWAFASGMALFACAYLALYRLQPPYPYPLRGLPLWVCLGLGALLALRHGPALARRARLATDALALGGIAAWLAAALAASQAHLTLSTPGVEKDFRVFATRAFDLDQVFKADGFYNLGYPLLLWLATPLAQGNPFLAARALAAVSGAGLLLAAWWPARRWLGSGPALVVPLALGLSPLVVQYALYVGSDMPFAALCALAVALVVRAAGSRSGGRAWLVAGAAGGAAFLVRHPGVLLLPLGWAALVAACRAATAPAADTGAAPAIGRPGALPRLLLAYTLGFALAAAPQIAVNLRDTGEPLYSQQAKNIWLAVYGDGDWGRWSETRDDVSLAEVALNDPGRLLAVWWANVRGFFGTGAEDTSEFGRALQLRLLAFPANWLAVAGLLGWVAVLAGRRGVRDEAPAGDMPGGVIALVLLGWVGLYVAGVAVGLSLQRFFLPLAPVYALAAAWAASWLARRLPLADGGRALLLVGLALAAALWGGFGAGADYVTRQRAGADQPGQPGAELAAAQLVASTLLPGEHVAVRPEPGDEDSLALTKYSAIAHLVVAAPDGGDAAALRATGAGYLLQSSGAPAAPAGAAVAGTAGGYTLYRLTP